MRHVHKMLYINGHDTKIDEEIYDQIKWFNENGYETGESCQGGEKLRGEITPLYIVFILLKKKQKRTLSKICKKLRVGFQPAYLYVPTNPHGRYIPFGMKISIKGEENRVGLLNEVITQLKRFPLKINPKMVKVINKNFSHAIFKIKK